MEELKELMELEVSSQIQTVWDSILSQREELDVVKSNVEELTQAETEHELDEDTIREFAREEADDLFEDKVYDIATEQAQDVVNDIDITEFTEFEELQLEVQALQDLVNLLQEKVFPKKTGAKK